MVSAQDVALVSALFEDQLRIFTIVHEADAAVDALTEVVQQVAQAAREAPLDIRLRDGVPTVGHPLGDA